MDPVTELNDLDVDLTRTADGQYRIDIIDKRRRTEVISLPDRQASWLAVAILAKLAPVSAAAGSRPPFVVGDGTPS